MRADRRRARRLPGRTARTASAFAGRVGVVGEPGQVLRSGSGSASARAPPRSARSGDPARATPRSRAARARAGSRAPRPSVEHPRREALGEVPRSRRRRAPPSEPDLDRPGDDGDGFEQAAPGLAQAARAREHGVANGRRNASAGGEDLGDEERVAAVACRCSPPGRAARLGERAPPRPRRERRERQARPCGARQLAQHERGAGGAAPTSSSRNVTTTSDGRRIDPPTE